MPPTKGADVLHKALNLIELFEQHRQLGLAEVVRHAGLPKATTFRLLTALEAHGFLKRTNDRGYALGLRFLRLGTRVAEGLNVRRLALPHMRRLRDQTGQSVQLAVVDGNEGVYVERFEGTAAVRLYIAVGRRAPLYAGASTRLLLAYASPERQAEILAASPPVPHTPATPVDPAVLRKVLAKTVSEGWTVSHGELQPGSAEMAAPVFDYRGRVVAALSVAGADSQYGPDQIEHYLPLLKAAAAGVSREMGHGHAEAGDD